MAYHYCMTNPCLICNPNPVFEDLLKEERVTTLFEEIQNKKAELDRIISDYGKAALKEAFTEFFNTNPTIEKIQWVQYIPGFNDGDPCVFTMHEAMALIPSRWNNEDGLEGEGLEAILQDCFNEEQPPWFDAWSLYDIAPGFENAEWKVQREHRIETPEYIALKDLNKILQGNPDTMQTVFGTHARVIASPEGFEVEEYDCGY